MFKRILIILMSLLLIVTCTFVFARVIITPSTSNSNILVKLGFRNTRKSSEAISIRTILPLSQYYVHKKLSSIYLSNIYVTDVGNNRVQKFDSNKIFITKWGSFGIDDGQFDSPTFVAVTKNQI